MDYLFQHIQNVWYVYLLGCAVVGAISWLHVTFLKVRKLIVIADTINKEFQPNSGSTLCDKVTDLQTRLHNLENKLDAIEANKLLTHIHISNLDAINIPMIITDFDGNITWANQAFNHLVDDKNTLDNVLELVHESDRHAFKSCIKSLQTKVKFIQQMTLIIKHKPHDVVCEGKNYEGSGCLFTFNMDTKL